MIKTEILGASDIERAAAIIRRGGLVAVPTETVYGLAGDGLSEEAARKIYEAKGRPEIKPLSLMVPDAQGFAQCCIDVPRAAYVLAKAFWPGPLTIVARAAESVPGIVRAGGETVGLRCPDHPLTLKLLREVKLPLAAPSANPSGAASPKSARDVMESLGGRIDAVLDGGSCGLGVESTIIDMSKTPYTILRHGALPDGEVYSALVSGMTLIGVTGGSGAGKTTLLEVLSSMGAYTIDCDEVYHALLANGGEMLDEIKREFPGAFDGGRFNRKKLGSIVFSDAGKLLLLNDITHRHVGARVEVLLREAALNGAGAAAIDAVALIESGIADKCGAVIGVVAPEQDRIDRITAREGLQPEYARLRVKAQKPDSFYRENCRYILSNDGGREDFISRARELSGEIMTEAGEA